MWPTFCCFSAKCENGFTRFIVVLEFRLEKGLPDKDRKRYHAEGQGHEHHNLKQPILLSDTHRFEGRAREVSHLRVWYIRQQIRKSNAGPVMGDSDY